MSLSCIVYTVTAFVFDTSQRQHFSSKSKVQLALQVPGFGYILLGFFLICELITATIKHKEKKTHLNSVSSPYLECNGIYEIIVVNHWIDGQDLYTQFI